MICLLAKNAKFHTFADMSLKLLQYDSLQLKTSLIMVNGKCTGVFRGIFWLGGGVEKRGYVVETFHGGISPGGKRFP